jgi:hypothetical protein
MSTNLNLDSSVSFPAAVMADGGPLPEFCGPSPGFVPYLWTAEHRSLRAARARHARFGALAFYRIQAQRMAARGNVTAASWYAERAAMYARITRRQPSAPLTNASDLREEIASWLVMSDTIRREAHLTAEDYMYA